MEGCRFCIQGNKASLCQPSPAQPSPGCEQPTDRLSWKTKLAFCFCCPRGATASWVQAGPKDHSQGSAGTLPPRSAAPMAEGRGAWPPWEAIPQSRVQEMGEGRGSWELDLSWRPGARKWGFVLALPLNYLVGLPPLGLSLPTCKRSLMYLMIPKGDSPMTSLFLSRPEPSRMAELPSRVFQFIHSAIISKYFLRMEMEGEERGQREDRRALRHR